MKCDSCEEISRKLDNLISEIKILKNVVDIVSQSQLELLEKISKRDIS